MLMGRAAVEYLEELKLKHPLEELRLFHLGRLALAHCCSFWWYNDRMMIVIDDTKMNNNRGQELSLPTKLWNLFGL